MPNLFLMWCKGRERGLALVCQKGVDNGLLKDDDSGKVVGKVINT